jgi:hypothetical protein
MRNTHVVADRERGSVLLCVLMVTTLVGTLGAALALIVSTETFAAANYQSSQQGLYAADAALERTVGELRLLPTWVAVPGAAATSSADFNDGLSTPRMPNGLTLNLTQLTSRRQAESDAIYPSGPDHPVWHLYGHAPLNRMIPDAASVSAYVVVWLADDPDDLDGNPAIDANDVILVRAEAFGVRGGRRAVEATIQREQAMAAGFPGVTRSDVGVIAWREVR